MLKPIDPGEHLRRKTESAFMSFLAELFRIVAVPFQTGESVGGCFGTITKDKAI